MELEVLGAQQYAALSRRLREAEDKGLQRELQRALTSASKPARQNVLDHLPVYLPDPYAEDLSRDLRFRTAGRGGGRGAGVRITATARGPRGPRLIGRLEAGKLRHPLYGNRRHWFPQAVYAGFFSEPIQDEAPRVREALIEGMQRVAEQIAG